MSTEPPLAPTSSEQAAPPTGEQLFRREALEHQRNRYLGAPIDLRTPSWVTVLLPYTLLAIVCLLIVFLQHRPRAKGWLTCDELFDNCTITVPGGANIVRHLPLNETVYVTPSKSSPGLEFVVQTIDLGGERVQGRLKPPTTSSRVQVEIIMPARPATRY